MSANFPEVRLAAVVISRGEEVLTILNPKWGAFSLPMSKRRVTTDPSGSSSTQAEDAQDAAIRAAAEALGRPLGHGELPTLIELPELQPFQQSDRDGAWKSYRFEVFGLELAAGETPEPTGGHAFAWLSLDAMRSVKPVSETAIRIVETIEAYAVLRGDR